MSSIRCFTYILFLGMRKLKNTTAYRFISLLLSAALVFNHFLYVRAETNGSAEPVGNAGDSLTADYVLPDWPEDTAEEPEHIEPALYEDGAILLYHYGQLLLVGTNAPVTDIDYIVNRCGDGQQVLSEEGRAVSYAPDADYRIVQDISLPRHSAWRLPEDFTGNIIGSPSTDPPLYDAESDTVYLYNLLQTAVMLRSDAQDQPVLSGDADVSTFGTGSVILPDSESHYITYSGKHNYVLASGFSADLTNVSPSVNLQTRSVPNRSVSQFDGRDFNGQVIKTINSIEYILIGNQEQLRAIGSDKDVLTAVYQMKHNGLNYEIDTDNNGNPIILYGGDADLLESQNGCKNFDFQQVTNKTRPTSYYAGVDQTTEDPYNTADKTSLTQLDTGSWHTGKTYSTKENYIIFRDIDLGGRSDDTSTYWTPLMFSGSMTGAVAENGEKIWNGTTILNSTAITATRRAVISNVHVNQNQPIEVNKYIGIGFFATITNEINANDYGVSAGTVKVKNLELNRVEVHNTADSAQSANSILSTITSGVGWLVGGLVDILLPVLSFGEINLNTRDMLSALLNARVNDPTIFSTGAFAGRIVGDVEIDNCSVTGSVAVTNIKNHTGGFVGYTNGVTQYSGLSQALGTLTNVLESSLNVIPGLGLGDLITILLQNALPLGKLIPTGYLEPHINTCTVENLVGTVGQNNTECNGGFVGLQIGTQMEHCAVKDSDYTVWATNYGGGFSGLARDAVVQGTLDGLGIDLFDVTQITSKLNDMNNFQTESLLQECCIENSAVTVNGGNYLGGFAGAMAASYAIDCDIRGTVSNPLTVSGSGSNIGGFAGEATIGWANSIGKNESNDNSLLSVVRQVAASLLSSEASANQKLLSLVGLVPSAIMGCQIDMSSVNVSGGGSFVGGIVGKGEGILLTESSAAFMNKLTYWEENNLTEKTERLNYLNHLESVTAGGDYAGGVTGEAGAVSLAGVLNSAVSAGSFLSFSVSKVTVTGIDTGYTVISDGTAASADGDFVAGGLGMACGGSIDKVHLQIIKKVEAANNKSAGFAGAAGPGDLVGSGGLTLNLLGLNNVLNVKSLLSLGQAIHVTISDSDVTGIEQGFTVESKGSGHSNSGYQYLASGFIAQSNSTEMINCHTYHLRWVKAADVQGYSGGFVAVSQTGGLADVSDVDGISSLLSIEGGLLGAISYLVPSYTNCTVTFVDGGYVSADIAGGFAADMQSGKADNAGIASVDDTADPKWTKMMSELYDPDAVKATGDLEKQFAVFNIDSVRGQTYAGGFAGKVRSGALAGSSGGISILGDVSNISINISDLLSVINAYVPFVHHAGVYSENGFVVAAQAIRSDDPYSGSAGGFAGYASGAQISHCDVYRLKHTEVTPPNDLESIAGLYYFDNQKSQYAVVGGHYAGGYVGNMDIGDAASVGNGLKILGSSIQLTNVLSALNVVVSTIEHSDVQGAGGGFSVISDGTDSNGKVGMAGGYAGSVYGGHIQNSHCKNFYYIIGQETAGGYAGNIEPGNVANLMEDTNLLNGLVNADSSLASLVEDFVPTIRNSTTSCVPCGGAVRAQAASDAGHQRGCAGGFCGHNEGGHIWGLNTDTWKDQNDGIVAGHDFGHNTDYTGEQHICTAWRIRSVYGYEYAGGFTGYMESADTAGTGNISLLGDLIQLNNLLGALSAVYPTEKNTAVYGPLRNLTVDTWNAWVTHIGIYGSYGDELSVNGMVETQEQLDIKLTKYIYGCHVAAGRSAHNPMVITPGGMAGGYVGYMVSGVISNGQAYDMKLIKAMRSAGGYAGRRVTVSPYHAAFGFTVKGTANTIPQFAGGFAGSLEASVIGSRKGESTIAVNGLRDVYGQYYAGGFVGLADVGSVDSVSSDEGTGGGTSILGLIQAGNVDVLDVFRTYIYYSEVNGVDEGITVKASTSAGQGILSETRYSGCAGGFGGGVMNGSVKHAKVTSLNTVSGLNYNGGFIGHMGKNGVADVDKAQIAGPLLAGLNAGVLDIFGTIVDDCEVQGIAAGAIVSSVGGEQPISGGFTGYGDLSQIKNSHVHRLKQVYSDAIAGGFIGKTNMEYLIAAEVDSELVQIVLQILNILLKILMIPNLENLDLLDTNALLSLIGVSEIPLGLKLLSDGDLLYVNLLGLKIGVSLVKDQGSNQTGTAIVTIGDSSVELPYDENGFNVENPEVIVNLLKGNATRVFNCSVTGIDIGYDVYGGGAYNDADGTDTNGYAGGFVGYNNEGRLLDNEMVYCDVVRGSPGKVGHFSGYSSLQTVYNHTSDELERNNVYHVYRDMGASYQYAQTAAGTSIGTASEDTGTPVTYNRFDMVNLAAPIERYADWENAYISPSASVTEASQAIGVYASSAKAVLMLDTPTSDNPQSQIPEPVQMQDPCKKNGITILKTDANGSKLSDAIFDLYYQDTITPPAYTFNEPIVPPTKTTTVTVNGTKPSHPGLEDTTTTATVTTYSYAYPSEPSLPSAEEADWILPRSDNDYIYFRDYNVGSPADHDKKSFANPGGSGNTSAAQDANRSWLRTDLKDNVETQHLEIDYDHRYWYAAQFSGSGKQDVQYAIWERFVDRYNGQDTVVWKIQPPDGYDYVRFCLYDGGQCIRTTEKIQFKLGQIWHKKDWGGMYKNENGNHCYFNVPLQQESDWAFYDGSPNDQRMDTWSATTTMQQAIRYTPTEQKITFHCNSNQVWHNIHIEFFRDVEDGETADITIDEKDYMYVGQHFPGFMMEPYAYAGDNYRVGNYLTYELTIPKEAKYFRVNNGIDNSTNKGTFTAASSSNPAQSPYAYRSAVRQLKGSEENGKKNYDNYYSFGSSAVNVSNSTSPVLHTWNGTPSADNRSKTYSDKPVDSDYDYIYFEAPSGWGNHIYAYFYGGGDLRNDNWQRAVYSIWPGVAATATEYTASGSETGTSDIYDYSSPINPESTYTDKNSRTVYKFRVPKGERKNYSKVIFNNGLKSRLSGNGGDGKLHETGVITFHRGYLYTSSGSSKLHNEATSTTSYEQRSDYLYIKNTAGWDDIHIQFYNSSGSQIFQTGEGYVMDYSGKQDGTEYFRIAIPKNAAKFSLSTGKQYSDDSNTSIQTRKTTGKYDILRYAPTETDTDKSDYTKGNMVFDLTGSGTTGTLTKTYPNLVQTEHTETYSGTETAPSLDSISNSPRGDYIYIKDTADVMTNTTPTFSFKDAGGSALTSPVVLKLDKDSSNHRWYRVGIPTNAALFTMNSGAAAYPVYPKSTSSTQQMNVTPGDMYFETVTNTMLNLSWPTFTSNADDLSDELFDDEDGTHPNGQRGDNLYLVHAESTLSDWTGMTVTFYDASGMPMANENGDTKIRAKSLGLLTAPPTGQSLIDGSTTDNADAQGYWYRVAIPYGAATFTVSNADGTNNTPKADIFELRDKISRYSKDYTLGDMQYRLNGTTPKLIYPIFTEVSNQTLEISEGQTISSESSVTRVDVSQVSDYADNHAAAATTQSDTLSTLPVLHATDTNTITYSWGGGNPNYDYVRFVDVYDWTEGGTKTIYAHFFGGTVSDGAKNSIATTETYRIGSTDYRVVKFEIPSGDPTGLSIRKHSNLDSNDTIQRTINITLKGSGHGYMYYPSSFAHSGSGTTETQHTFSDTNKGLLVQIAEPSDAAGGITASWGSSTSGGTGGYIWYYYGSSKSNETIKAYYYNSSSSTNPAPMIQARNPEKYLDGKYFYGIAYPNSGYNKVMIYNENGSNKIVLDIMDVSSSDVGKIVTKGDSNGTYSEPISNNNPFIQGPNNGMAGWTKYEVKDVTSDYSSLFGSPTTNYYISSLTWPNDVVPNTGSAKSATYQPEDRYGYINAVTDANDRTYKNTGESTYCTSDDNYIVIQTASGTTLTDPYIMFYSDDGATTAIGDTSTMETNGISLVKAKITGDSSTTDNTNPYTIRLPKKARSFKIGNGAGGTQGNAIPLYENVTVLSADGTIYAVLAENPAPYVTLTGYHHAGTTFSVGNDGNVTAKTLRTGKSVPAQTITDPLYPRTDNDYIFLTDVGNHFASSNTVYAYYYGGEDGEYTAWPGIQASTNDKAQLAYTDNDGNKVYMFRLPKVSDGKYPYVIFNNGSAVDGTRKITQKIDIMEASTSQGVTSYSYIAGGMNYRVDASDNTGTQHYGTYDSTASSTNYVTAYPTISVVKEADPTEYYGSNKMIYIIENGTNKLDGTTARDSFDDMHVIFYQSDKTTIVGGGDSGYKPDKLMSNSTTPVSYSDTAGAAGAGNVYRISVPADAMYFQITNGTKDGTTNQYMRQSELKAVTGNGLYRFVPSAANAEDYIEEDTATGNINEKHFLLDLVNKIVDDAEDTPESETYDVKLATVVTGSDGKQKKIIWLKLNDEETEVDTHYLDHTTADIWQQEGDSEVTSVHLRVDASKCYWKETVAPAGYKLKTEKIMVTSANTIVMDERLSAQIVLKKTAKEKVGTKDIGAALSGAKFRLVSVTDVSNDTLGSVITLVKLKNKYEYEYKPSDADMLASMTASGDYETTGSGNSATLVEYNIMTNDETPVYDMTKALVTGANGKLKVDNLPWGDYCLEEVQAPSGYSNIDSNTASNKRVYFSVGQNTVIKNITCSDEMEPAYIKLYEHINEKLDAWGDPTFIFKIKQTGYYDYSDETPVITNRNGKEILVALTVDNDGKWTAGLTSHSDPSYNYNDWYQESTDELENSVLEYFGQFRIDEQGRIRLEPGKYEITRMPVSRYEFVENTYTMDNIDDQAQNYIDNRTESEKLTLTIPAERTAIVHYYDKVGYYDKFSQVDEEINKFYTLDENTKANKTIKGIRIADYHQVGTEGDDADTVEVEDTSTEPATTTTTITVPVENLKIYKVYVDGTEELMSADDYEALSSTNFNITYTYDSESGDKIEFGGKAASGDDPAIPAQFSYSKTDKQITVTDTSDFENSVYTLNADYKGFKATFDIVFLRSST